MQGSKTQLRSLHLCGFNEMREMQTDACVRLPMTSLAATVLCTNGSCERASCRRAPQASHLRVR
eukprot:1006299-Pleurochrysis_carterae.AAC.1